MVRLFCHLTFFNSILWLAARFFSALFQIPLGTFWGCKFYRRGSPLSCLREYILKARGRTWITKYMKHECIENSFRKLEALMFERKVWVEKDNS